MPAAITQRLEKVFSVRAFFIALALSLTVLAAVFIWAGLRGAMPTAAVEKTVSIAPEKTVAVSSGDLNQLDITAPPPKAISPAPRIVVDAVEGLTEKTAYGLAPVVHKADGLTPFKAYSAGFTPDAAAKATVSFAVVDFGLSEKNSAMAIADLPAGVSFVMDAYARNAGKWVHDARTRNHEVWLSLPLQAQTYPQVDTGPKTVLASLSAAEATDRLLQTLSLTTSYAGVTIGNTDAFNGPAGGVIAPVVTAVSERGLGIVQSDRADKKFAALAAQTKAPYGQTDLWIDRVASEKEIQARLIDIEAAAVKNKKLIVFVRPYPAILKAVAAWSKSAASRGIQLAPLSYSVSR